MGQCAGLENERVEETYEDQKCFGDQRPIKISQQMIRELPHAIIGAITMEVQKGIPGLGTGVLISPDLVLTAAHNIYDSKTKKYSQGFRFYPGQHGPLGKYYSVKSWYVPKEFLIQNNPTTDYALLRLENPTSATVFLKFQSEEQRIEEEDRIGVFGYLGEQLKSTNPYDPYQMTLHQWGLTGSPKIIEQFRKKKGDIIYSLSTSQGQSGAPILLIKKDRTVKIIGVHKGLVRFTQNERKECFNAARHLTRELIEKLRREAKKLGGIPFSISQDLGVVKTLTKQQIQKYQKTLKKCRKNLKINPKDVQVLYKMGVVLNNLGRKEEAIEYFSRIIAIDPKYQWGNYKMGDVLKDLGRKEEAMEWFRKTIAINPKHTNAHHSMGSILRDLNKKEEAIEWYRKTIEIDPKFQMGYYDMGDVLYSLGKKEEAMEWYRKGIAINPDFKMGNYKMGDVLSSLGKKEEAMEWFEKTIAIDPNYSLAHYCMGEVLSSLWRYEEAQGYFCRAIELDPSHDYYFTHFFSLLDSPSQKAKGLSFLRGEMGKHPNCKQLAEAIDLLQKKCS